MTTPQAMKPETAVRTGRAIGRWGTAARLLVGGLLLADVALGHIAHGLHPAPWALGLVGFPAVLLVAQWLRTRRRGQPSLRATGPLGHAANAVAFLALYATPCAATTKSAACSSRRSTTPSAPRRPATAHHIGWGRVSRSDEASTYVDAYPRVNVG